MASSYAGSIRRIENKHALHLLLYEVPGKNGIRTVTKKGIRIAGLTYWGNSLRVGKRVFVRHDPEDLGRIYCFTEDEREFICTAENYELSGINPSLAAQAAKEEQKRRINEEIEPLKREIKRIKPRDMIDSILQNAIQDSDNIEPFPNKIIKHVTRDLTSLTDALNDPGVDFPANQISVEREKKTARQRLENQISTQEIRDSKAEFRSKKARFERAIALEILLQDGAGLSPLDQKWLDRYHRGAEYKSRKRAFDYENSSQTVG
ncbi:MAG: Mu transposase C-terminal domain-containing protein [Sneathiella sp.]|nr:Mu transposase C-terminal domain-containing protein [Sneathiella sp.]